MSFLGYINLSIALACTALVKHGLWKWASVAAGLDSSGDSSVKPKVELQVSSLSPLCTLDQLHLVSQLQLLGKWLVWKGLLLVDILSSFHGPA
jgi:hypothetical protein